MEDTNHAQSVEEIDRGCGIRLPQRGDSYCKQAIRSACKKYQNEYRLCFLFPAIFDNVRSSVRVVVCSGTIRGDTEWLVPSLETEVRTIYLFYCESGRQQACNDDEVV